MTGSDFREWRKAAGMTQIEAARAIGVSRRTIQEWEADAPIPKSIANLVRLMGDRRLSPLPARQI